MPFSLFRRDWTREGDKENRVTIMAIVTGIAVVLSLFVLSLPAIDVLVTDAGIRWAFFLIICVLLALLLLRIAYPGSGGQFARFETSPEESAGPVRRMSSIIEKGIGGDSMSQMAAYLELKKAAIRHVSVLRMISQDEMESLLRDKDRLAKVIHDEDIVELVTADLHRAFLNPHSPLDSMWRFSFDVRFNSLLGKLEDWQ